MKVDVRASLGWHLFSSVLWFERFANRLGAPASRRVVHHIICRMETGAACIGSPVRAVRHWLRWPVTVWT